jgi:hypothetical protein
MNYLLYVWLLFNICANAYILTTSTKNVKLCKNCKYFVESEFSEKLGKCEKYGIVNEITGDTISPIACIVRKSPFLCGPEAKGYENKYTKKIDDFGEIIDF